MTAITDITFASLAGLNTLSPDISADGRFVVFVGTTGQPISSIDDIDLRPGSITSEIYLYDRQTGLPPIVLSSGKITNEPAGEIFHRPAISADGRYVVFEGFFDDPTFLNRPTTALYVYDRLTSQTHPLSFPAVGQQDVVDIDADGQLIAVVSVQGGITIVNPNNNVAQQTSDSIVTAGGSFFGFVSPQISADGRFVTFWAHNSISPTSNPPPSPLLELFLYDLTNRTFRAIATSSSVSSPSPLSADDRFVAFASDAANPSPAGANTPAFLSSGTDANGSADVFLYDRINNTIMRVSNTQSGSAANGPSNLPAISADGRYVGFVSSASNLVAGDSNGQADVFLFDRLLGAPLQQISIGPNGIGNSASSLGIALDQDGTLVTFGSFATNLTSASDTNNHTDIFIADITAATPPPAVVFSSGADVVDFNHLSPAQQQAIAGGADLYHGLGGNDTVTLPSTANFNESVGSGHVLGWTDTPGSTFFTGSHFGDTNHIRGSDGNYRIVLGAGSETLNINGNGSSNITAGFDHDAITISGNGRNTINGGHGSVDLSIAGSGANTLQGDVQPTISNAPDGGFSFTNSSISIDGGGSLYVDIIGTFIGIANIGSNSTLEFHSQGNGAIHFNGAHATLKIDHAANFNGLIYGFGQSDTIDLADVSFDTGGSVGFDLNKPHTLDVVVKNQTYELQFDPSLDFSNGSFELSLDANGDTKVQLKTGMSINLTFDSSVPSNLIPSIQAAATSLEQQLSDPVTVNLLISLGGAETGGIPLHGSNLPYSQLRQELLDDERSSVDRQVVLPTNNDLLPNSANSFFVSSAQEKALSLVNGNTYANDSNTSPEHFQYVQDWVGTRYNFKYYDGVANFAQDTSAGQVTTAALHELTHAMGRISGNFVEEPTVLDLYRFGASDYQWDFGKAAHFSFDGNNKLLADFGIDSDQGDFLSPLIDETHTQNPGLFHNTFSDLTTGDPFNEVNPLVTNGLTATDIALMDVIGFDSSSTNYSPKQYKVGAAIKGHLSNATVFVDANENGQLDAGESSTETDASGRFILPYQGGPLVAIGGTDTSTGLDFKGTLETPEGWSDITPLTSLVYLLEKQGDPNAEAQVLTAFGLDPLLDLSNLDPIDAANAGNMNGAAAEVAGAKVYDTISLIGSTLAGAAGNFTEAMHDGFAALASAIGGPGLNLGDPAAVSVLIGNVAQAEHLGLAPGVADAVAAIAAAGNIALDHALGTEHSGSDLVNGTAAIELVMQGAAAKSAGDAAGNANLLDGVVGLFTGDNLTALVTHAQDQVLTLGQDQGPMAFNGSGITNEDAVLTGTLTAIDLYGNTVSTGQLVASDTDGPLLSFIQVSNSAHGSVTVNADGTFSYTPNANFNGSDSFTFEANDGSLDSNVATVSLTINAVNDPPAITSDGGGGTASVSVLERTTVVTTVVATDVDGPSLTYSIVGGADAAKFQIDGATGALSFITAPNFDIPTDTDHNNSYIVQVRASDGSLSDDQSITVQVTDNPAVTSTVHWVRSVDIAPHPAGWVPQGNGDFNGDGTIDDVWYNASTNNIDIWTLSNGTWAASSNVGSHPAGYQPVGFGDYNGDHSSDVLWYNPTTRDVDLWKISNGQGAGSVDIGTHPAGFTPALSGDFNGDGTSDIAWYNPTTSAIDIWKISNGQWAGSVDVGSHPAGYQPVLAGDFNGDGTSDIAWYNPTTHDVDIWKMSNGGWAGSVDVGTHPAGWQPLAAADFSLDGTSDIAWYNPTTNDIDIWLIKNGQWAGSFDIGSHPGAGLIPPNGQGGGTTAVLPVVAVGVGDFDHSGVADIMWQDKNTGHIDNWMLAYS